MSETGKLIVIEGLDGSGKATQASELAQFLTDAGAEVLQISFPDYDSKSSALVKMYLNGEIGKIDEVNAYAASSFYAADRYISYQTGWKTSYEKGVPIIADRYTTSNAVHQMAKLPREEWDRYLDWLWDFEFIRMGLPAPEVVIYLDMHPDTSRILLEKRNAQDGRKPDLHESDLAYLLSCRNAALYAAQKLGWHVLCCCDGKEPLPIAEIAKEVARTYMTYR